MLDLPPVLAQRYRVGAPLGHGAIAEVVRACDERAHPVRREVALKVLYPALRENAVVVERFRREVDLVRRIVHPHVLSIHDVVDSDGFLFLVMDFHPGGDLADRLARGRLPFQALGRLASQLGGALHAAHQKGIVHRDVKPSNVLTGAGNDLDVRLCDFGLARSAERSGLTTSAAVLGTPEYMAPEVIAEGHADPRSDVYSLGVVLFEAATGRLPFVADSPYQLMQLQLQQTPPRPRDLVPDLPAAMDEAIVRALEKDPLDRFASAAELAEAFAPASTAKPPASLQRWAEEEAARRLSPPAIRAQCPVCGGWLVAAAGSCVDCGHQSLILESDPKGVAVLVGGPGEIGDKIDAARHVDLFRVLREVLDREPTDVANPSRSSAPRFPFYVARQLTQASAERLVARIGTMGLTATIQRGGRFAPKEMRRKVKVLGWRIVAATGLLSYGYQLPGLMPRNLPDWVVWLVMGGVLGIPSAYALTMVHRWSRPLLATAVGASHDHSRRLGASSQEGDAIARLSTRLRELDSRQDRRLLARILERVLQLQEDGETSTAGAAGRADDVAKGLTALDAADRATAETALSAAAAQAEVRRVERGRVLLRGELLRLSSHLEAIALARVRADGRGATDDAAAINEAALGLALTLEVERELDEFLGDKAASIGRGRGA